MGRKKQRRVTTALAEEKKVERKLKKNTNATRLGLTVLTESAIGRLQAEKPPLASGSLRKDNRQGETECSSLGGKRLGDQPTRGTRQELDAVQGNFEKIKRGDTREGKNDWPTLEGHVMFGYPCSRTPTRGGTANHWTPRLRKRKGLGKYAGEHLIRGMLKPNTESHTQREYS